MSLLFKRPLVSALDLSVSKSVYASALTYKKPPNGETWAVGGKRTLSSSYKKPPGSKLGQTSVFLQTGLKIRELPLVVKKVNDVLKISGMDRFRDVIEPNTIVKEDYKLFYPSEMDAETAEIVNGFNRCLSAAGIFRLLETIPAEEVTPPVAIHALKKIIDLENNSFFRNSSYRETLRGTNRSAITSEDCQTSNNNNRNETFLRIAFINMLLDIVYRCRGPNVILEGLKIVSRDTFKEEQAQNAYKERMCEETLVCISEGIFNLKQICEAIVIFGDFFPDNKKACYNITDKLWSGLLDKADQINAETISSVFATLPHLKWSRDIVLKLLEEKAGEFWQGYRVANILEILKVLTHLNYTNNKILKVISQWLKMNIHTMNENETLAVIYCFHNLNYIDDTIINTMEKYLKVRGCQIQEKDLVATICDYCLDFRVRSRTILEGSSEYFIEHGRSLSTPQVFSITRIFGELNFHPPNGFKFWEIVEDVLEHKFVEFPPKEIINLFLSFIYIERYPLNFVRKIFNPYFMDRLHQQTDAEVMLSRSQLKLFDNAMKMESRNYGGPYLPKDTHYRTIPVDFQLLRVSSQLVEPLGEIVGDVSRIGKSVILSSLPLHPLYLVDLMIYPSSSASLLRFGRNSDNSQNIAVVVHSREHFLRGSKTDLIGPQEMRIRHLKSMGFRVMQVNAEEVAKLKMHQSQLKKYLAEKYYKILNNSTT